MLYDQNQRINEIIARVGEQFNLLTHEKSYGSTIMLQSKYAQNLP